MKRCWSIKARSQLNYGLLSWNAQNKLHTNSQIIIWQEIMPTSRLIHIFLLFVHKYIALLLIQGQYSLVQRVD
jgi:hypothetical protein